MTNPKQSHTPGPWELGALVNNDEGVLHRQVIARSQSSVSGATITPAICTVSGYSSRRDDNARLIAAAPDMLELLKSLWELRGQINHDSIIWKEVKQVITKAEGE